MPTQTNMFIIKVSKCQWPFHVWWKEPQHKPSLWGHYNYTQTTYTTSKGYKILYADFFSLLKSLTFFLKPKILQCSYLTHTYCQTPFWNWAGQVEHIKPMLKHGWQNIYTGTVVSKTCREVSFIIWIQRVMKIPANWDFLVLCSKNTALNTPFEWLPACRP